MSLADTVGKLQRIKIFSVERTRKKEAKSRPWVAKNKFTRNYSDILQNANGVVMMVNPDKISESYNWVLNIKGEPGSKSAEVKYVKTAAKTFELPILLDATGVMPTAIMPIDIPEIVPKEVEKLLSINAQLELFHAVTGKYKGKDHGPNLTVIAWGEFFFKGYLESLDLNYTLFGQGGRALRVEGTAKFVESVPVQLEAAEKAPESPDLSHLRTVKAGDTLPLMCLEVYGDDSRYLEVARYNGLLSFREIEPGMALKFPPIAQ